MVDNRGLISIEKQSEPAAGLGTAVCVPLCTCSFRTYPMDGWRVAHTLRKRKRINNLYRTAYARVIDCPKQVCYKCGKPEDAIPDMWLVWQRVCLSYGGTTRISKYLEIDPYFRAAFQLDTANRTVQVLSGCSSEEEVREHPVYREWLSKLEDAEKRYEGVFHYEPLVVLSPEQWLYRL